MAVGLWCALSTGLMTLSMLSLVTGFYHHKKRHLIASGIFGGLACLTHDLCFFVIVHLLHDFVERATENLAEAVRQFESASGICPF